MSETKQKVACYKVTLPTKKTIILREPKISDTRVASQVAGKKAKDNQAYLGVCMQEELVKLLLVEVDGKVLSAVEKEQIDSIFSLKEYGWVLKAVQQITGDEEEGELQMEFASSGA